MLAWTTSCSASKKASVAPSTRRSSTSSPEATSRSSVPRTSESPRTEKVPDSTWVAPAFRPRSRRPAAGPGGARPMASRVSRTARRSSTSTAPALERSTRIIS